MGKLIYSMSVSLDGFVETPSRSLDWSRTRNARRFNGEARAMSAFLYGRRLYEVMVGDGRPPVEHSRPRRWRSSSPDWKPMKIVFSRTLQQVGWNSRPRAR